MNTIAPIAASKTALRWGWFLSALPSLMMLQSVAVKFILPAGVPEHFAALGWPADLVPRLAVLELACTIVYLVPRTAALGAVLLTGYLGAAAAAHVRIADSGVAAYPIVLSLLLWGGLWLRDPRLRAMLPLQR